MAKPVSEFVNATTMYQDHATNRAFREQETVNLQQRQRLMQQMEEQSAKDNKEFDHKAVLAMYPLHQQQNILKAWTLGGIIDPESGVMRGRDVRSTPDLINKFPDIALSINQSEYDNIVAENEKLAKKGDPESQAKMMSNSAEAANLKKLIDKATGGGKDRFSPVNTDKGIVPFNTGTGEAGAPFGQAPPNAAGSVDPAVVRTFEAAHPELVSKRGTTEYGQALEAFIKAGERPYSTFVGLTPDGKQAITFDSRKGTVGLQPLPFAGEIQPKIKPTVPTEQTTAFQQIGTLKEALGQVIDKYEESFVGPIAGPTGKIQDNWGVMPDAKRAEFRALTHNLFNTIIYLRSGKQINEEEAKRLLDELPTMNISPVAFQAKIKKFTWELDSIQRGKMRELKGAGYRNVGETQEQPTPQGSGGISREDALAELKRRGTVK